MCSQKSLFKNGSIKNLLEFIVPNFLSFLLSENDNLYLADYFSNSSYSLYFVEDYTNISLNFYTLKSTFKKILSKNWDQEFILSVEDGRISFTELSVVQLIPIFIVWIKILCWLAEKIVLIAKKNWLNGSEEANIRQIFLFVELFKSRQFRVFIWFHLVSPITTFFKINSQN